jgi:hypothetical protein
MVVNLYLYLDLMEYEINNNNNNRKVHDTLIVLHTAIIAGTMVKEDSK